MTITARKPSALATIAMPIPVLPAVPSTIAPPGRKRAAPDRVLDDRERRSVLDRAARIHELRLAENRASRGLGGGAKLDEWGAANRCDNIAYRLHHTPLGFRAKLGDGASCDKPRPLPQGSWGATRVFYCLENILDARLADQPPVVRRADRRRAVLWRAGPLWARTRTRRDPRPYCRGDAPLGRAPDRAIGRPLPRPAGQYEPAHRNHRARRGDRRRDQRRSRPDDIRRGRRSGSPRP